MSVAFKVEPLEPARDVSMAAPQADPSGAERDIHVEPIRDRLESSRQRVTMFRLQRPNKNAAATAPRRSPRDVVAPLGVLPHVLRFDVLGSRTSC